MKQSIFDEQTSTALKKWRKNAGLQKKKSQGRITETRTLGGTPPDESPADSSPRDATPKQSTATILTSVDRSVDPYDNRDLLSGP